jgi:DNA polymerase III epsilon subunit-like protein
MIVFDIETTGLSPTKNAMVSFGAVDYDTGEEFYGECRIIPTFQLVEAEALAVNGFSLDSVNDVAKGFDFDLYASFLKWTEGRETLLAGQQVGSFDIAFLRAIHDRCGWFGKWPFGHRSVDLHSIAFAKFGKSLSLDGVLKAVGLEPEPKPHNALTGARLERDAFKRLL